VLDVTAMFVAIGHDPRSGSGLVKGVLPTDEDGYLTTKAPTTYTEIPGVFAAGDLVDRNLPPGHHRPPGSGCAAAIDAERWLADDEGRLGAGRWRATAPASRPPPSSH